MGGRCSGFREADGPDGPAVCGVGMNDVPPGPAVSCTGVPARSILLIASTLDLRWFRCSSVSGSKEGALGVGSGYDKQVVKVDFCFLFEESEAWDWGLAFAVLRGVDGFSITLLGLCTPGPVEASALSVALAGGDRSMSNLPDQPSPKSYNDLYPPVPE